MVKEYKTRRTKRIMADHSEAVTANSELCRVSKSC